MLLELTGGGSHQLCYAVITTMVGLLSEMIMSECLYEKCTWSSIRKILMGVSKELVTLIDRLSPDKNLPLLKLRYPFGAKISDHSDFYWPQSPCSLSLHEPPHEIKELLNYQTIPLGVITKNSLESCFDVNQKIIPQAVYKNGVHIGATEYLGGTCQATLYSGARSIFMLPKISETLAHRQLRKRFGITGSPPKHPYDHWKVFRQLIAQQPEVDWTSEVIFFTTPWMKQLKKDPAWATLDAYFSKCSWQHSRAIRDRALFNILWEDFVSSLNSQELKFDPYVVDTLKQLIYIIAGVVPGSAPYNGSDEFGPLNNLQTIYEDTKGYGLEKYFATIMQPQYFAEGSPVYYSMQLPTLFESLPRTKKITSMIDNLRELSELFSCFAHYQQSSRTDFTLGTVSMKELMQKVNVNFYHSDMFAYGNIIKSSLKMPEFDPRFNYSPNPTSSRTFANNSTFFKGCIVLY